MSVEMWNCHSWPLHVSSKVKLPCLTIRCQYRECISESEHVIIKFGSQCELHLKLAGYISQLISELHLKIWTHISSWSLHLTSFGGYIGIWTLHLKIWISVCTSFETEGGISDSSFGYCIWKFELTSHLGHFIWQFLGGEILKLPFWPLHVSSKVQLPFVTNRWQWQYEIAILDHYMSVEMWNCHSWPLHVSSKEKLPCLTIRCQYRGCISESEHFIWKFGSQCELHLKLGGISDSLSQNCIWKLELTSHLGHFIWQFLGGKFWNCHFDHYMSVAMWNCHSWPLHVSSNVKLPFLTTTCQ